MFQSLNKSITSLICPAGQIYGICSVMVDGHCEWSSKICVSMQITNSL